MSFVSAFDIFSAKFGVTACQNPDIDSLPLRELFSVTLMKGSVIF